MLGPTFAFGRRGGSKRNRVAMSESINDASFGGVVGRHFHSYSITNCQTNESLAHLSGDVAEDVVTVVQFDPEHGVGEGLGDLALHLDLLFFRHAASLSAGPAASAGPCGAGAQIFVTFTAFGPLSPDSSS